jgi:hypothetical protein
MKAFRVRGRLNQDVSIEFKAYEWFGRINCNAKGFTGARSIGRMVVKPNRKNFIYLDLSEGSLAVYAVNGNDTHLLADRSIHGEITQPLPVGKYQIRIIGKDAQFHLVVSKNLHVFKPTA